jgi:hypothetical protein
MHLKPKYINIILNALLGASWAFTFYALLYGFFSIEANFFVKLINALIYAMAGLLLVLVLEVIYRFFINHELIKEQTKLLKELKNSD